jgi:acetyl-CoA acyltransferase
MKINICQSIQHHPLQKYGTTARHFAMIGEKNHRHSVNNPYAQFRQQYTLEQVEQSTKIYEPLTKLQCSPTSDGAGAAIVCSEEFVRKHGLAGQAVEIVGQSMTTDSLVSFDQEEHERSVINMVGFPMAQKAAQEVYKQAGVSPDQVDVVELHDCFSCNELITYEALGLCPEGKGGELVASGNCTYGGK